MLTTDQKTAVEAPTTRPVYLVEIAHGGESQLLSASGDVIFDGRFFTAGGVNIRSIRDAESASIELPFTPERVGEIQSGAWRRGVCKIWAIVAGVDDPPATEYATSDGFLRLDGRIQSSQLSGNRILVSVAHVLAGSTISPAHTYNSVASFIPPSGTTITWEGDSITLESRR